MRILRTVIVVLLVALGFLGGYIAGWYLHGENVVRLSPQQRTTAEQAGSLQQRIIEELQGRYYKPVDVDRLTLAGVRGLLRSLKDPYTVYLTPREVRQYEEKERGVYYGIGASLQKKGRRLIITGVFDGSPAQKAGLKAGDVIVTVDGKPTADEAIEASIARIKGEEGTKVRLGVKAGGRGPVRTFTLTRARIEIPETKDRLLRAGGVKVGYVQLYEFGGFAARDVRRDVATLQRRGARWFILDLRYNGGGLLDQAVDVTSVFTRGLVTTTEGLHSPRQELEATGEPVTDRPLIVLVNQYSASASEIVTGALQDHGRAVVIGTRTFGKGLVQSIVPLGNGAALKLTTAVYRTPEGRDINGKGIKPDIVVRDDPATARDEVLQRALRYIVAQR